MSSIVEILHVGDRGKLTNLKNTGTIFFHQCPFKKMPLLYFDYVKTPDFGPEKKILVQSNLDLRTGSIVTPCDLVTFL